MDKKLNDIQVGALLHDIGKIVRRARESNLKHSDAGAKYLKENEILNNDDSEIYNIIKYHHFKELKEANLPSNSLAYIVYEADNIASGVDRVKYEEGEEKGNEMLPLNSIFNKINMAKNKEEKIFDLKKFNKDSFDMPKFKHENEKIDRNEYFKILNTLKNNLIDMRKNFTPEKLVSLMEEICLYFPSSSYVDYPDISYYDHVKLTAAISACLYLYDKNNNIENYKEQYFKDNKEERKKEKFLFVSGEFTGIQNFIYAITSKMAMKSLRGKSFYLELFTEHIIDEILNVLGLSRVNLIYSGGSQFYLLLPNIEESKKILNKYKEIVNNFLLKEAGTSVYFEISYTSTSAEDIGNGLSEKIKKENKIGEIFKKTSIQTSKSKLNRYTVEQLRRLFDENSDLNKIRSYTKECKICKKSEKEIILEKNSKEESFGNQEICNTCKNYVKLGKDISKLYYSNDKFIVEEIDKEDSESLLFPTYLGGYVSIKFKSEKDVQDMLNNGNESLYRFYSVNNSYYGKGMTNNIRIGNYNIANEKESDSLIEFKELVKNSKGIKRLAVFRADVDNLGMLFQTGFINENSEEPYKFVKFSKSVVLSRYLSDFFKRKINLILEKKGAADNRNEIFKEYCNVIVENNDKSRDIVVVYSGGDDIFAIGTWNDIIEFSVDLRTAFKEFTNNKVTMSAGIGIFSENFPVYQMANITGELESLAKKYPNDENPTKDAVALFGKLKDKELEYVYNWDIFIDKVLYEKYSYLKSKITFDENSNSEKIFVGKSKWYILMDLVKEIILKDERLDIARFAYTLARIKNNKKNQENYQNFKEKIFKWAKNKEDAKQLLTAINILIYEERGE